MVNLKTRDLEIRPFSKADFPAMGALLTNSGIKKTYMIPDLVSQEAVDRLCLRFWEFSRAEDHYVAGIYLGENLIGFLNDVENDGVRVELGYVIAPDCQGRGYATQVLTAVIKDLFSRGYREVAAGAFEENAASIRVMEKSGMTKTGFEEDIEYRGKNHHCVYYSISRG